MKNWKVVADWAESIDKSIGWAKLPTPLALPVLIGLRDRLRAKNLYDTGRGALDKPPFTDPNQADYLGARTLDGNLQPAQPGLGLVIAKTLAPVVPMRIFGAHEAWARGSKKIRLHPITIVVGHPIFFTQADIAERGKDVYQRLSERVMNEIAKLTIDGNE